MKEKRCFIADQKPNATNERDGFATLHRPMTWCTKIQVKASHRKIIKIK